MNRFKSVSMLMAAALLAGCATTPPYGHGDVVVGKKAIFRHKTNNMQKLDCTECHDKLYTNVKQHEKHEMSQLMEGDSCGTCHNGNRAFSVSGNCYKCHKK